MIVESNRCPQCGRVTRGGALDGLCPACVARMSLVLEVLDDSSTASTDGCVGEFNPTPPPELLPSNWGRPTGTQQFGDYELLEEIGRGGMGIVYRARQTGLDRIVAVKMIPFGALASEESVRRFRTEAEAAARLRHSNIVAIHEIGERDGQHFFSMDYIAGATLAEALRDGAWPATRAAVCLQSVARAVHHAHQSGILHRDLKPSNILIDSQGQPHVADFGLARKLTGDSTLTLTGQVLGSPNYMPPEQASPGRTAPGPASDLYSLGAVLYHLLTGRPPFQAETMEVVLAQVATAEPVSPRLLNPEVPRDLETICLKCLEKEPARRYGTAEELAEELDRFLRDEPILATPAGRVEKTWRWCRRRPALATTLALLLVVGLGGATGVFWQWRRAEAAGGKTERYLYAANMELAYEAFAKGDRGRARQLLEAYLPSRGTGSGAGATQRDLHDLRGWEWRHLWSLCRGEERLTLARHAGAVVALDYSPDGRWLASGDVRGGLQVWDTSNRVSVLVTNLPEGRINALAFSPDGNLLAHTTARRRVWLWNTRSSPWERVATLAQADVSQLAFAPDGKRLATANGMEVVLWDLETHKPAKVIRPTRDQPEPRLVAFSPDGHTLAVADANGYVVYWDPASATERARWRSHRPSADGMGTVKGLTFSPLGRWLATAGTDGSLRLWTAPKMYRPLSNHTDVVTCVAFSPDGRRLVSGSMDQSVRLWDVVSQQELARWHAHAGGCLKVRFAADGQSFASSGVDGTVKLWDLQPRTAEVEARALPPKVRDVMVFSRPPTVAMTLAEQEWRVWSLPALNEQSRGRHWTNAYSSLRAAGSGRMLEYAGGEVRIRQVADGHIESLARFEVGAVLSTDLSRDGQVLVVSGVNGIVASRVSTQAELRRWMTPGEGWGRHVRIAPDGATVVTLHEHDGAVTFRDVASGSSIVVAGHSIGGSVLTFSADGYHLATAGLGGAVRLYDVPGRKAVASLAQTSGTVTALAFAPDSTRLACGLSRGPITLWDLATGREVAVLEGHATMIYSMAFLDDDTLASATREEIRLWRGPITLADELAKKDSL